MTQIGYIKYIPILKNIPLFSGNSESFIEEIAQACNEKKFRTDDIIFLKGDESDGLYIILEGSVKVHDDDYTYARMVKGHIIGEYSLLDTQNRSASVTALEPTTMLFLDKDKFASLMTYRPEVLHGMLQMFTTRLREHNKREENQNKEKEAILRIKDDLTEQQDFLMHQGDKAAEQKLKITESINYAKKIQSALLPSSEKMDALWGEHFIFNKPKDTVSGDFYWTFANNTYKYIAAADCTGHGVPGAFMCMLGVTALNQIASEMKEEPIAGEILNILRKNVINTLNQRREINSSKDGMDIALCVYDEKNKSLQYSGAYNSLILFRNGEMIIYKANRMPIGAFINDSVPFDTSIIHIRNNDVVYLFSDGFSDQFGEHNRKKFGSGNFKELLNQIHRLPMSEQKNIIRKTHKEWKGHLKQTDDVLVIGIRFNL